VDAFSGSTPPTDQWRWGETNLPGATNSVLTLDLSAMAVGEGDFWISVAMANEFGVRK
jgi:hypothetical protein